MGRSNEDVERSEVAGRSRERRDRMVKLGWLAKLEGSMLGSKSGVSRDDLDRTSCEGTDGWSGPMLRIDRV